MSGSRSYSPSDASEQPERSDLVLSLQTVQKMLPLVQQIVADILGRNRGMLRLRPEEARLDRQKRQLDWPARQRRYQIKEELTLLERELHGAIAELHELGLALLDEDVGLIGFPTQVNDRLAYFSWQPGEESLQSWRFADEDVQHPIPDAWFKDVSLTTST